MPNKYSESIRKWESSCKKDKHQLYIAYVMFKIGLDSIYYEDKDFSELFIEVTKKVDPSVTEKSMGGLINSFNRLYLTQSYGPSHEYKRNESAPNLRLTSKGAEFFFFLGNKILEHGKKFELDKLLPNHVKSNIPNKYLNT